jgi:hypothetical protein
MCEHEVVREELVRNDCTVHRVPRGQFDDATIIFVCRVRDALMRGRIIPENHILDHGESRMIFFSWVDENFCFCLRKFPEPDNALTRGNLISVCFSDLRHSKRKFLPVKPEKVLKINKHPLGSLWSEIANPLCTWSDRCLEHQIKTGNIPECPDTTALWAFYAVFVDQPLDL